MKDAFVIAGGGSGAKVVEAMVHLCAAGLGPEQLYVLLVDGDSQNGNLKRTLETIDCYQKLQCWPWAIDVNGKTQQPFRTRIQSFKLAESVGGNLTAQWGLAGLYKSDPDLDAAMRLMYDADEMSNSFQFGFHARPNVGCLLLADHINKFMDTSASSSASEFVDEMVKAAGLADAKGQMCPVIVVGSLFGGTGSSLLPVAQDCAAKAFADRDSHHFRNLSWARCMLLPYFRPAEMVDMVDPNRFLLDASDALMFYGSASFAGPTYLIGSASSARNLVDANSGGPTQANPGYIEEVFAALGALTFMDEVFGGVVPKPEVRLMGTEDRVTVDFASLPVSDASRDDMAYLLHLGAFFLRHGAEKNVGEHDMGLYEYLRSFDIRPEALTKVPWFSHFTMPWAMSLDLSDLRSGSPAAECARVLLKGGTDGGQGVNVESLRDTPYAGSLKDAALEYFARLVLWACGVFNRPARGPEPADVQGLAFDSKVEHFRSVHSTMCLKDGVFPRGFVEGGAVDNMLAQLCRVALAAMQLEEQGVYGRVDVPNFTLWERKHGAEAQSKRVMLAVDESQVVGVLNKHLRQAMRASVDSMAQGYRARTE